MKYIGRRSTLVCVAVMAMIVWALSPALGMSDNYQAMKNYINAYTSICKGFSGTDRSGRLDHLRRKYDHLVYKMTAEGRDMLARFGKSTERCADGDSGACSNAADLAHSLLTLVDNLPVHRP